ncbi:MAG: SpoIIE family protein phosphatase [Leptolyngbyaceae cyanobacterium MO_188.B28]|nr:SpoIIE family protein phosphatase [Leptolyngbyaceae cyanobacterium MO_188.B28]
MSQDDPEKLKLMVVDDEQDNLDLLYRTFRRDFQVYKAENGFQALDILEQAGEMGIIISDQRMPKMNGTEFLGRTVERFPDTIRIVLTGYTDVEDLVEAINAGQVFKYITKPWTPDQLRNVVFQAAETYKVLKHRTQALSRALRRESLFNTIMTAIRGSLDYHSMLATIVATLGETFEAHYAVLKPVEASTGVEASAGAASLQYQLQKDRYVYSVDPVSSKLSPLTVEQLNSLEPTIQVVEGQNFLKDDQIKLEKFTSEQPVIKVLIVPLSYQKHRLAVVFLYQVGNSKNWDKETIEQISSITEQVALAISQAKLYQRTQLQTEQMQAELEVARQFQTNLLRQTLPEIDGLRIQAQCLPARQVGGDFFEVFVHPQGDIWLAVGDVSGKGVPAALFMVSAISVLRRELSQDTCPEPELVMRNLNSGLLDDLVNNNCFITMVLARYTPSTQKLVYANAGHIYPLVWPHRQLAVQRHEKQPNDPVNPTYLQVRGVPLGILSTWKASAGEVTLAAGDALLLTSDGITEATISGQGDCSSGAMLKQTGLWQLLQKQPNPLDLGSILSEVQAFNAQQEDDQTILSLEVL